MFVLDYEEMNIHVMTKKKTTTTTTLVDLFVYVLLEHPTSIYFNET